MSKSLLFATELIKKYKWRSIFVRYWKTLIIAFLIPFLLINSIVYLLYSNLLDKEFNASILNSYGKTCDTIENIFSDIDAQCGLFAYDNNIISKLSSYSLTEIHENSTFIYDKISNFILAKDYMDSLYIYSVHDNYVYSSRGGNYLNRFSDTVWFEHYQKIGNPNFVIAQKDQNGYNRIIVSYGIQSGKNTLGIIVFNISSNYIKNLISSDMNTNLDNLIIAENQNVIFSSNYTASEESYGKIKDKLFDINTSDVLTKHNIDNDTYFTKNILGGYITLLFDVNSNYINERTSGIPTIFMICLAISIILTILMALYISLTYYRSIHQITVALNQTDDFDNTNEISYILDNIIHMTVANKHFEKELVEKIQLLKKTQSIALQSQFNPHFLFNTLNMINILVSEYAKGDNDASRAIILLSDLLYASMKTNDYVITFDEELNYEDKYIKILEMQHENRFRMELEIDERTRSCKVIRLMLQPIIENAFRYGMKLMTPSELFVIRIKSYIESDYLIINVFNNGPGVDKKTLDSLRNSLKNDDILQNKHIGLNNINQRIKILFGDNYGVSVDSDGKGFSTTIRLPRT